MNEDDLEFLINSIKDSKNQKRQTLFNLNKKLDDIKKNQNETRKALNEGDWGIIFSFLEKDFEKTTEQEPKLFEEMILSVNYKNDFYIEHIFNTYWLQIVNYYQGQSWDINQLLNRALLSGNEDFCSFLLSKDKDFSLTLKDEIKKTKDNQVFQKINNSYTLLESAISNKKLSSYYIIKFWDDYFEVDFNSDNNIIIETFKRKDNDIIKKVMDVALEKNVKPYVLFDNSTIDFLINKKIDFIETMQSYQKNFIIKLEKRVLESNNNASQEREYLSSSVSIKSNQNKKRHFL